MAKSTIEVSDDLRATLTELARQCSDVNLERNGATTHGVLTVEDMICMLAEDAGMVITRPGSWEGANMAQVFSSHGYQI